MLRAFGHEKRPRRDGSVLIKRVSSTFARFRCSTSKLWYSQILYHIVYDQLSKTPILSSR